MQSPVCAFLDSHLTFLYGDPPAIPLFLLAFHFSFRWNAFCDPFMSSTIPLILFSSFGSVEILHSIPAVLDFAPQPVRRALVHERRLTHVS